MRSFFGKLLTWGAEVKGRNIHWGGRGLGSYSLIFFPAPPSQEAEAFFLYLALIMSVMASVPDGYFLSGRLILL